EVVDVVQRPDSGQGQIRIHGMDLSGNVPEQSFPGDAFAANGKSHGTASADVVVDGRGGGTVDAVGVNILGYADDFIPRTLVAEAKALAESVGRIPPILARHVVGNDGDGTLAEDIVPGKVAAGDEARPLRGQKAGRQTANRTVGRHLVLRCSAF